MPAYLLLLHETPADWAGISANDMADVVQRYADWAQALAAKGQLTGGEKLADDGGRQLRLKAGQPVATDGPYAEAHDVIGGYFVISAADDDAAQAVAATCPHLGGTRGRSWIEIRRIEPT